MNALKTNPFKFQATSKRRYSVRGFARRTHEGTSVMGATSGYDLGLPVKTKYLWLVFVVIGLFFALFLVRVIQLQVFQGPRLRALAEGNRVKLERTLAPRGIILDRNLKPLVANEPSFALKLLTANVPNVASERSQTSDRLLELIRRDSHIEDVNEIRTLIAGVYAVQADVPQEEVISVLDELDHETAVAIQLESRLPGVLLEEGISRRYLDSNYVAHVSGYLGKIGAKEWSDYREQDYYYGDLVGRVGLESQYEALLRGTDHLTAIEVNSRGQKQRIIGEQELEPGHNLILSLDLELQKALGIALNRYTRPAGGRGAAVALDPRTGEILALVSAPSFDANAFVSGDLDTVTKLLQDKRQPLFNRAVNGEYPPGSTFKPLVAVAALEPGLITPKTHFLSTGGIDVNGFYYPDWQAGGHGWTNLNKAIAESVNTYFYYISGGFEEFVGLGIDKIVEQAREFGLGSKLGIDLGFEANGFLPSRAWKREVKGEPWYVGDTYHLGIGQGDILVTPLQLASVTAVFANGGTLYQPHLLRTVRTADGDIVRQVEPRVLADQVASPESMSAVRRALRETVLNGSAASLQTLPVSSAGKTGTAQVGGDQEPHGWFTGWAPYDDPEIVLTVLVENGAGGNTSALPVFREVLQQYFLR